MREFKETRVKYKLAKNWKLEKKGEKSKGSNRRRGTGGTGAPERGTCPQAGRLGTEKHTDARTHTHTNTHRHLEINTQTNTKIPYAHAMPS